MTMPMLSRKAFATNSLKQTFVWDVWFYSQIVCSKTQSTPNNSNSSIDILFVGLKVGSVKIFHVNYEN